MDETNSPNLSQVEAAIAAVLPSEDPLDSPSFSTVDYINETFPTEQSLNNLDDVMAEMRFKVQCVDDDIRYVSQAWTCDPENVASTLLKSSYSGGS